MMKKKATTLLAVLLMGAIALTGCSAPHTVNGSAEAVSVNGTSVPLGELNFYLRYQQANMQNAYGGMFGETFMNTDITGSGSVYGSSWYQRLARRRTVGETRGFQIEKGRHYSW